MPKACEKCGKIAQRANKISHSNRKTPRRQHPNLQIKTTDGNRELLCTRCIKTMSK